MLTVLALLMLVQTTTPPTIPVLVPGVPFRIGWEGGPNDLFRWACNDVIRKNFTAAELIKGAPTTGGLVAYEATVPGLPVGVYSCGIWATTPTWEAAKLPDAKSDPIALLAGSGPLTPMRLMIIVTVNPQIVK
jgi:hypothetical protein